MIKDIGTEGLAVGTVTYEGADKAKKGDIYENTHKFTVRRPVNAEKAFKNCGRVMMPPAGMQTEMIDVTTLADTKRRYMQRLTESTGPR